MHNNFPKQTSLDPLTHSVIFSETCSKYSNSNMAQKLQKASCFFLNKMLTEYNHRRNKTCHNLNVTHGKTRGSF